MNVFTLIESSNSPQKGHSVSSSVYYDLTSARDSVARDIDLILQYGLGDEFGLPLDGEDICLGDYSEGELLLDGSDLKFTGNIITAWYGNKGSGFEEACCYRHFKIVRNSVLGFRPRIPDWEFLFDERFPDTAGVNLAGILTDGSRCLYWHAFKDGEDSPIERCHIYESIMLSPESEVCSYDWTAENDSLVIDTLNGGGEEVISSLRRLFFT